MCLKKGVDPLFWNRFIKMDIELRITLQNNIFGFAELHKNTIKANDKYYHYCFEKSYKHCENCGTPLFANRNMECYSSYYISHIISKGARADMAHDPRNHNILCPKCHDKWENGKKHEMLIYLDNTVVIRELKNDYYDFNVK